MEVLQDVQYTQYELPMVEIELDNAMNSAKQAQLMENCFTVMPELNMYNVTVNFRSIHAVDRWLSEFSQPVEAVNFIAKLDLPTFVYAFTHYPEAIKAYSDVIVEVTTEELPQIKFQSTDHFAPMLQLRVCCNEALLLQIDELVAHMSRVGTVKCILVEPDYQQEIDFKSYNLLISAISSLNSNVRTFLERGNFPAHVLRAHPCNAYILSCGNCHAGKKDLPRTFTIKSDGAVYPEGIDPQLPGFLMGNIYSTKLDNLLQNYRFSENHLRFKEACKRVFHDFLLDYPFSAMPWRYFYLLKAKELGTEVGENA